MKNKKELLQENPSFMKKELFKEELLVGIAFSFKTT